MRRFPSFATRHLRAAWIVVFAVTTASAVAAGAFVWARSGGTPPPQAQESPAESYVCPMHPDVKQATPGRCPICGMALEKQTPAQSAGAHSAAHGARAIAENPATSVVAPPEAAIGAEPRGVLTLDGRRQQLIGVRTVLVTEDALTRTIRATGIVRFDESRWADVNIRAEGYIRKLYVERTGDTIRRGQPLLALYSPELATAQAEYVLALSNRDAVVARGGTGTGAEIARDQADRLVSAARQRLDRWDLPAAHVTELEKQKQVPPVVTFPSPASGVVMEKRAVEGMRVMPGESLYRVVDTSEVWIEADVYEADIAAVKLGQPARVTVEALPGETFTGRVTWVAPTLDETARTARARVQLPNRGGRLKPGMFAQVQLESTLARGTVVPADALLDTGQKQFVFVTDGAGFFEPRAVRAGQRINGRVQVEGVKAGEQVAASATFFIDSESQLRAALEGYQPTPSAGPQGPAASRLAITLRSNPDPPRAGMTRFEVEVKTPEGAPVTDAAVTLVLFMPAMPSMNMPAMRSDATLGHAGNGIYRGSIDVMMNGRWDATVAVTRGAERLGSRQFPIIAR